jgi:enoyl-CoA hydratase/carnithine racemase
MTGMRVVLTRAWEFAVDRRRSPRLQKYLHRRMSLPDTAEQGTDMTTGIESTLVLGVLHLVFVTEDGLNTMDDPWFEALEAHLREATEDTAVRVVLLSARGKLFCAGAHLQGMRRSALLQGFAGSPLERLTARLAAFPKPLLAAVHGKAIGGGATLLLHCDLVVAASDTQFRLPFTSLAAVPELGSSFLLPRAGGSRLASELLLLGNVFDSQKAVRAGFVTEIVAPGEELPLAQQWAEQLASLAPTSVQGTKRLLREAREEGLLAAIDREGTALAKALVSAEVGEALAAFTEKRRPDYSHFQ